MPTTIEDLKQREYLTPAECARVFGHGRNFWVDAFDRRLVTGHRAGKRIHPRTRRVVGERHIEAESARAYLKGLDIGHVQAAPVVESEGRAAQRAWLAARRQQARQMREAADKAAEGQGSGQKGAPGDGTS